MSDPRIAGIREALGYIPTLCRCSWPADDGWDGWKHDNSCETGRGMSKHEERALAALSDIEREMGELREALEWLASAEPVLTEDGREVRISRELWRSFSENAQAHTQEEG